MNTDNVRAQVVEAARDAVRAAKNAEHWREDFRAALHGLDTLLNVAGELRDGNGFLDTSDPIEAAKAVLAPDGLLARLQALVAERRERGLLFVRAAATCRHAADAIREATKAQ